MDIIFNKIIELLDSKKIKYELLEHEPTPTSKDSARVRGTREDQGAKAILLRSEGKFILCVLPGNEKIDLNKLRLLISKKSLSLATREEVVKITNCIPGEVPPFGNIFNTKTYVDKTLLRNEKIAFNAGLTTKSIIMLTKDFLNIVNPIIDDFAQ